MRFGKQKQFNQRILTVCTSIIIFILSFCIVLMGQEKKCQKCDRAATVTKAENPDKPPNYKELYKIYEDCISQHIGNDNWEYDTYDDNFRAANKVCEHLRPQFDWIYKVGIASRIAELYTTPCFHMSGIEVVEAYRRRGWHEGWGQIIKAPKYKIPEYSFEAVFRNVVKGEIDKHGKPGKSALTIKLYYDGDNRELVRTWKTVGTLPWIGAHFHRTFKNPDAKMRLDKPIENILWDFEKKPVTCQIEPAKDELHVGEQIEVKLTNFKDGKGQPSREFNRIGVKVKHGRIIGGTSCATNPEYKIFTLENKPVTFTYITPDTCDFTEDTFDIYNSCDILPEKKLALKNTKIRKKIASKKISIYCPEVYAKITYKHIYYNKRYDDSVYGVVKKGESRETKKITFFVEFDKKPEIISKEFDQATKSFKPIRISYKIKNYSIQSSSYQNNGTSFHSWYHGDEYRQSSFTESDSSIDLKEHNPGTTMILELDKKSNRIYHVSLPSFVATLRITGNHKCVLKERYGGTKDCSTGDYERRGKFVVSPSGSAEECEKVTGGDGKTSIKGECKYKVKREQSGDDYFYRWEVRIKK